MDIQNVGGQLVVDSRLVANELNIEHDSLVKNIVKYEAKIKKAFGHPRLEVETVANSVGAVNEVRYYWLTEQQASFLMTLSRNTDAVVEAKLDLVVSFEMAKQFIIKQAVELELAKKENTRLSRALTSRTEVHPPDHMSMQSKCRAEHWCPIRCNNYIVLKCSGFSREEWLTGTKIDQALTGEWSIDYIEDPDIQRDIAAVKRNLVSRQSGMYKTYKGQQERLTKR